MPDASPEDGGALPPPPPPPPQPLLGTEADDNDEFAVLIWVLVGLGVLLVCGVAAALGIAAARRRRQGAEPPGAVELGVASEGGTPKDPPDGGNAPRSPDTVTASGVTPAAELPGPERDPASPALHRTSPDLPAKRRLSLCQRTACPRPITLPPSSDTSDSGEVEVAHAASPLVPPPNPNRLAVSPKGPAGPRTPAAGAALPGFNLTINSIPGDMSMSQCTRASDGRGRCFRDFATVGMQVVHDIRGEGIVTKFNTTQRIIWIKYHTGDEHHYAEPSLFEGKIQPRGSVKLPRPVVQATSAASPREGPGKVSPSSRVLPERKLVAGSVWFVTRVGDKIEVLSGDSWVTGRVHRLNPLTVHAEGEPEPQPWPDVQRHPDSPWGEVYVPGVDHAYWARSEVVQREVRRPGGGGAPRWGIPVRTRDDLVLASIVPGSPFDQAGIAAGMRIISVGEAAVGSKEELRRALGDAPERFTVTLERARLERLTLRRHDDNSVTARGRPAAGAKAKQYETLPVSEQPAESHILWDDGAMWILSRPPSFDPVARVYCGRVWAPAEETALADAEAPLSSSGESDWSAQRAPTSAEGLRPLRAAPDASPVLGLADSPGDSPVGEQHLVVLRSMECRHREWLALWRKHFAAQHGREATRADAALDSEAARVAREARQLKLRHTVGALELQRTQRVAGAPETLETPSPDDIAHWWTMREQWRRDQGKQSEAESVTETVDRVVVSCGKERPEQVTARDLSRDSVALLMEQVRRLRVSVRRCGGAATPSRVARAFPELHALVQKARRTAYYTEARRNIVGGDQDDLC